MGDVHGKEPALAPEAGMAVLEADGADLRRKWEEMAREEKKTAGVGSDLPEQRDHTVTQPVESTLPGERGRQKPAVSSTAGCCLTPQPS